MSKDQKGFIVYGDNQEVVNRLSDEDAGRLLKGMLNYFADGAEPDFDGILEFVFIPIRQQMDRDMDKYETKCEKNRANANKRWNDMRTDANAYDRMRSDANDANTKTKTKTNTDTDTDTTTKTKTKTNTKAVVVVGDDGKSYTDIWKSVDTDDVETIYDAYPETGGDLIQVVHDYVKNSRKVIKLPVQYILGYAKRTGWDDTADHGGAP